MHLLQFCEEFTKPMIHTIQLLEKQQEKLCDIIEKKDNEIKRHNFENGEITKSKVKIKITISNFSCFYIKFIKYTY